MGRRAGGINVTAGSPRKAEENLHTPLFTSIYLRKVETFKRPGGRAIWHYKLKGLKPYLMELVLLRHPDAGGGKACRHFVSAVVF